MRNLVSLPALGVLLAAGVAGGIHLGESAVAEIDPVHFRGPAIHPRDRGAAIDPNEIEPDEPRFASLYGRDDAAEAVPAGYAVDDAADDAAPPVRDPLERDLAEAAEAVAVAVERSEDWAEQALAEAERALARAERAPDWQEVERYAYYPVSAEEAEAAERWTDSELDDSYPAGGL